MARACFACGEAMTDLWWGYHCEPCEVFELKGEAPMRMLSHIDPDTKEEILYYDHSAGSWPSPG